MLGRRIGGRTGTRHIGRDRPIVDDPATLRVLVTHGAEGLSGDVERSVEVDAHHVLPGRDTDIAEHRAGCGHAGIVEHDVDSTEFVDDAGKEPMHGRRIRPVADRVICRVGALRRFRQLLLAPCQHRDAETGLAQSRSCRAPDPRTSARDHGNFTLTHSSALSIFPPQYRPEAALANAGVSEATP